MKKFLLVVAGVILLALPALVNAAVIDMTGECKTMNLKYQTLTANGDIDGTGTSARLVAHNPKAKKATAKGIDNAFLSVDDIDIVDAGVDGTSTFGPLNAIVANGVDGVASNIVFDNTVVTIDNGLLFIPKGRKGVANFDCTIFSTVSGTATYDPVNATLLGTGKLLFLNASGELRAVSNNRGAVNVTIANLTAQSGFDPTAAGGTGPGIYGVVADPAVPAVAAIPALVTLADGVTVVTPQYIAVGVTQAALDAMADQAAFDAVNTPLVAAALNVIATNLFTLPGGVGQVNLAGPGADVTASYLALGVTQATLNGYANQAAFDAGAQATLLAAVPSILGTDLFTALVPAVAAIPAGATSSLDGTFDPVLVNNIKIGPMKLIQ